MISKKGGGRIAIQPIAPEDPKEAKQRQADRKRDLNVDFLFLADKSD
jgi:hypothetical protein